MSHETFSVMFKHCFVGQIVDYSDKYLYFVNVRMTLLRKDFLKKVGIPQLTECLS